MEHLPKKIHHNGISYTLMGDYYIPDLRLPKVPAANGIDVTDDGKITGLF